MRSLSSVVLSLLLVSCTANQENVLSAKAAEHTDPKLAAIIAGDHRSPENKARDKYRNPLETLSFFGIKDNMTVVEFSPGTGWYTEILAPYLRDNGTLYAAGADPESTREYFRNSAKNFAAKITASPEHFDKVKVTIFAPPEKVQIAPEGSADMVLTFRNVHNWMAGGSSQEAFRAFYRALKPGGVLGVVEHRADPQAPEDPTAPTGYVPEKEVIRLAQAAGFTLEAKSEINANPKDTKDHPAGVWTLPPTYRLKDKDREKYAAIGESDRMTLRFRK